MPGRAAIVFDKVWKVYGRVEVLRGASFRVPSGVLAGLVGPNGSGKTTSLRLALGLARPNRGIVEVLGSDPWSDEEVRQRIGYLPEKPLYPPDVTVERFLAHAARLRGLPRPWEEARRVARLTGIVDWLSCSIGSLSRGYLQRLGLAYALLGTPELLLLDEPTANLDPVARVEILELVKTLAEDLGATVVVSTHILPEMERIAGYLVAIVAGRVVDYGSLGELLARYGAESVYEAETAPGAAREIAATLIRSKQVKGVEVAGEHVLIVRSVPGGAKALESLLSELQDKGLLRSYRLRTGSLEQLYRVLAAG